MIGRRERPVGAADACARRGAALECLRAGDLVDEVQVDVEQPGFTSWASQILSNIVFGIVDPSSRGLLGPVRSAAPEPSRRRPPGRSPPARSSQVVRKVCVERDAVSLLSSCADRHTRDHRPLDSAVSRLPGSCIGGSSLAPVTAPAASVCGRARRAGRAARRSAPRAVAAAALPPCGAGGADDGDRPALVQAEELGQPQLEARGDRAATVSVGLVSPRSTWEASAR